MTTSTPTTRQPTQRALATRSLTKAMRLKGEARRVALQEHAALVWMPKTCTLVGRTTRL